LRRAAGQRRLPLPRSAQAGTAGPDHREVEEDRPRPPREILLAHSPRPRAPGRRSRELEEDFLGDHAGRAAEGGVAVSWRKWILVVPLRLRSLFLRRRVERDLQDELAFHLDMEASRYAEAGVDAVEAERGARRTFGGVESIKDA